MRPSGNLFIKSITAKSILVCPLPPGKQMMYGKWLSFYKRFANVIFIILLYVWMNFIVHQELLYLLLFIDLFKTVKHIFPTFFFWESWTQKNSKVCPRLYSKRWCLILYLNLRGFHSGATLLQHCWLDCSIDSVLSNMGSYDGLAILKIFKWTMVKNYHTNCTGYVFCCI